MSHRYAVVDGYSVELGGEASLSFNLLFDDLPYVVQMCVTRNKLGE